MVAVRRLGALVALIAGMFVAAGVSAQGYPGKPLKWIVPYPAGGGSDVIARLIGGPLATALGQPVVVDNRPGAATIVGTEALVKSPGDGYTIATADSATLLFNPHLYSKLPYDPAKDLAHVAMIGRFPLVLAVHPSVPVSSAKELIAYATANPGKLSYGSPGVGSPHHMAMVMFEDRTGARLSHVPYKGIAPAIPELLNGNLQAMFLDLASGLQHIRGGKLKTLGVGWGTRLDSLPDVPTLSEAGVKEFVAFAVQGVVAPAGTPRDVVTRLNGEVNKALRTPEVAKRFAEMGMLPSIGTPEQFAEAAAREREDWGRLIRARGIKVE